MLFLFSRSRRARGNVVRDLCSLCTHNAALSLVHVFLVNLSIPRGRAASASLLSLLASRVTRHCPRSAGWRMDGAHCPAYACWRPASFSTPAPPPPPRAQRLRHRSAGAGAAGAATAAAEDARSAGEWRVLRPSRPRWTIDTRADDFSPARSGPARDLVLSEGFRNLSFLWLCERIRGVECQGGRVFFAYRRAC